MHLSLPENQKNTDMKEIIYNVDEDGRTLLHLAVDSGSLPVSDRSDEVVLEKNQPLATLL